MEMSSRSEPTFRRQPPNLLSSELTDLLREHLFLKLPVSALSSLACRCKAMNQVVGTMPLSFWRQSAARDAPVPAAFTCSSRCEAQGLVRRCVGPLSAQPVCMQVGTAACSQSPLLPDCCTPPCCSCCILRCFPLHALSVHVLNQELICRLLLCN